MVLSAGVLVPEHLLAVKEALWPGVRFYGKQLEVMVAAVTKRETYVPAGNKLGKDYVAGLLVLCCFLACHARGITCRIVTTSVAEHHLKVLWGEIGRFIGTSSRPLVFDRGGPLQVNHQEVRRADEMHSKNPLSYLAGRVSRHGEGMAGHHADFTMLVGDESSGLDDVVYEMGQGWAQHMVFLGNPNPCTNMFFRGVELGDTDTSQVIHMQATDSPNVQAGTKVYPGLLSKEEYDYRVAKWDEVRQCVGLFGRFWKGAQLLLYPPGWLDRAHQVAERLAATGRKRVAEGVGIDPGEGMANTSFCAVDHLGAFDLHSIKTADTSLVVPEAIAFGRKHGLDRSAQASDPYSTGGRWHRLMFDAGGGGKQHADAMRARGFPVRTVSFGAKLVLDPKRGMRMLEEKVENREEGQVYLNRRVQMAHEVSMLLDPATNPTGFGIPGIECGPQWRELRRQMAPIPRLVDGEGRFWLPPKNKKDKDSKVKTLVEMLGASPDEWDSFLVACHAMLHEARPSEAGAVG